MASRTPLFAEAIKSIIEARLKHVHTALPGRVEKYDAAKQLVNVQPLIQVKYRAEDGTEILESLPIVVNVPVAFPGANGFRVTFPIVQGDTVLLVFSESSLDRWLSQGGLVDPVDHVARHELTDAIAIPGLRDFAHALASAPTDRATFGHDTGMQIHIDESTISLGGDDASEGVGLGATIKTYLDGLKSYIDNTLFTTGMTVIGGGGGVAKAAGTSPAVPTVESGTVKAKP
jgi:hypothetical protein